LVGTDVKWVSGDVAWTGGRTWKRGKWYR